MRHFPLLLLLPLLYGCSKEESSSGTNPDEKPSVAFGYHLNGYVAPAQVSFTNQSSNATTYLWDFGDGSTSTEVHPVHVYGSGGTYTVKLIAGNGQASATAGITLAIQPPYASCTLTGILLDSLSFTRPAGQLWDTASGPDVRIKVLYRQTMNVLAATNTASDVTAAMLPVFFDVSPPLAFPLFDQEYDVLLYDDDPPGQEELMGGYYFRLSDATTISYHYPDTMVLEQQGAPLRMRLLLDWGY
jgi:hypothetical protein